MKQVLKGGTVVTGSGSFREDVLIYGEKVAVVGSPGEIKRLTDRDIGVVDVEGCPLFPESIDTYTYFDLHVAGIVTADDFATGTKAAVRGGITTIVDFGTQYTGESLVDGLRNWHEKMDGKCSCDCGFYMSISDWNPPVNRELNDMMEEGITFLKSYMTYGTQVDDKTISEILCRLKEVSSITGVHCENSGIVAALQVETKTVGKMGAESHPATRPTAAEAEVIDRLLRLAEAVDTPVIVAHLTCKEGYDVIVEARGREQKVYVETYPRYLLMDNSLYSLPSMEAAKYVCAPPLRKKEDSQCLWNALVDGTIQTIPMDHYSFTTEQRALGRGDFTRIPGGMSGVKTRGTLLYTYGVDGGRITQEKMCQLLSESPAKLYGMYPVKGATTPGSDADIVVPWLDVDDVVTAGGQVQNVGYASFEGARLTARIESVFLRGSQVVKDHQVVAEKAGKFVRRGEYNLQS